jgi:hypothetical protein
MENLIKLEIFSNDGKLNSVIQSIKLRHFKSREEIIDNILNEPSSTSQEYEISNDNDKNPLLGSSELEELPDYLKLVTGTQFKPHILDLSKVSHSVRHILYEKGKYYALIKLLNTPCGNFVKEILEINSQDFIVYPDNYDMRIFKKPHR